MPVRLPSLQPSGHSPTTLALAVAFGTAVSCALVCGSLALGGSHSAKPWVLAVSVVYGVVLSAGAGWSAYVFRLWQVERRSLRETQARASEMVCRIEQLEGAATAAGERVSQLTVDAAAKQEQLLSAQADAGRLRLRLSEVEADASRLAEEVIPQVAKELGAGASLGTALAGAPVLSEPAHQRVLARVTEEMLAGERLRAATLAACASAAGRAQALSTSILADLRDMENRYDEEVLGDLLKLDHFTAQVGRLADSIAVLTGGRSGRRWTKPIIMESILRGAMSRISAYQRVRLHSTSAVAVVGYAAEGVMHALAELMDNATKFSPPMELVHVYVEELTSGVMITIEDAGLVMSPAALRRAQHAVSNSPLNLGTLSGTRLGLAVVGGLAHKHGLSVYFRPSSRGGTGVLLLIPQQLITRPRVDPSRRSSPVTGGGSPRNQAGSAATVPAGAAGLPKRRSGEQTETVPATATPAEVSAAGPAPAPGEAGSPQGAQAPGDDPIGEDLYVLPKRVRGRTMAEAPHPAGQSTPAVAPTPPPGSNLGVRFGAFAAAAKRQGDSHRNLPASTTDDPS
jgi:signal transduction histidine kinase